MIHIKTFSEFIHIKDFKDSYKNFYKKNLMIKKKILSKYTVLVYSVLLLYLTKTEYKFLRVDSNVGPIQVMEKSSVLHFNFIFSCFFVYVLYLDLFNVQLCMYLGVLLQNHDYRSQHYLRQLKTGACIEEFCFLKFLL